MYLFTFTEEILNGKLHFLRSELKYGFNSSCNWQHETLWVIKKRAYVQHISFSKF